jgi:hypothetical protein
MPTSAAETCPAFNRTSKNILFAFIKFSQTDIFYGLNERARTSYNAKFGRRLEFAK